MEKMITSCGECMYYMATMKGGWCSSKHEPVKRYQDGCEKFEKNEVQD